jgi:superoxide reductase
LTLDSQTLRLGRTEAQQEQDFFASINRPKDMNNLTGLEAKHVPKLLLPPTISAGQPFALKVQVGQTMHPIERQHYIEWVEVFLGEVWIAQVLFSAVRTQPKAEFSLVLDAPAQIRAQIPPNVKADAPSCWAQMCNIHGTWENAVEAPVS